MKKILFISLAVVLGLSVGLIGCTTPTGPTGPTPSDTIVIGMSRSMTGVLKDIHELAFSPVYSTYVTLHPSITVGGETFPVEVDAKDDGSIMANMLDNTELIIEDIEDGKTHFLFGPTCTAFLQAQAPLASEAHVVQMTAEGGATSLIPQIADFDYTFVNLPFSDWFQIPVLAKLLAEAHEAAFPGDTPHAYIGYQNDDHGLEYSSVAETYFAPEGIVVDGKFPMDSGDVTANEQLIAKAKTSESDILCVFAYPEHVFGTAAVANALGYNPNAVVMGPGANFGVYGLAIAGNLSEGVMCFTVANAKTSPAMEELFDDILIPNIAGGLASVDFWGHPLYWAAMEIWQEAVENVGEVQDGGFVIDQDDYRDYLRTHKFTTVMGETWYVDGPSLTWPVPADSGGFMNYQCHTGEIGQWQNFYVETIGYDGIATGTDPYGLDNYVVTADFIYPKPAWTP